MLLLGFFAVAVLLYVYNSVLRVPEKNEVIMERWGKFSRVLTAGTYLINPIAERPRNYTWTWNTQAPGTTHTTSRNQSAWTVPTTALIYNMGAITQNTKDRISVKIDPCVQFVILDTKRAVYSINDLTRHIEITISTKIAGIVRSINLEHINSIEELLDRDLTDTRKTFLENYGVNIVSAKIESVDLPKEFTTEIQTARVAEVKENTRTLQLKKEWERKTIEEQGKAEIAQLSLERQRQEAVKAAETTALTEKIRQQQEFDSARIRSESQSLEQLKRVETECLEILKKSEAEKTRVDTLVRLGIVPQQVLQYVAAERFAKSLEVAFANPNTRIVMSPTETLSTSNLANTFFAAMEKQMTVVQQRV